MAVCCARFRAILGAVNRVAVTPDSKLAISTSQDNTLKIWSLANGRLLRTLEGHSDVVNGSP